LLGLVFVVGGFVVGDVLAVVDDARLSVELLVIREFHDVAHVDVFGECSALRLEVEIAFGLGVGGEPVFSVDLLVVGGEGRLQVFMAGTRVLRYRLAVNEDNLQVLLLNPYFSLEVVLSFDEGFGRDGEDVGVELVDALAAEVVDVVFGLIFGGEDERQAMLDFVEVGGSHEDAFEGVLRGEDDVFFALAGVGEGDVCDLLVLAVDAVGVFGDGVDFDGLAIGVVFAGFGEERLALAEFLDDFVYGDASGRRGIERSEASRLLRRDEGRLKEGEGKKANGDRDIDARERLHRYDSRCDWGRP